MKIRGTSHIPKIKPGTIFQAAKADVRDGYARQSIGWSDQAVLVFPELKAGR